MNTALSVLALLVSLLALALVLLPSLQRSRTPAADGSDLPTDTRALRAEVAALLAESALALKHLAVVRYDAFTDTGGQLSWSLALLDDHGNGAVLTSIHGRTEARTYAKSIAAWKCEQPLSEEEAAAVERARG